MEISALQPHVKAADLPLEKLATNNSLTDEQKVGEVCKQFEAVFLRQILQEARKTVITSSFDDDNSATSGIYNDMINSQMAESISRSGTFGLAKSLQAQLIHQVLPHSGHSTPGETLEGAATNHPKSTRK